VVDVEPDRDGPVLGEQLALHVGIDRHGCQVAVDRGVQFEVVRQCNVTKRVRTAKGILYCPVVIVANGRIKPDLVLVNGKRERHLDGAYYLEWRENGRRVRLSVGKDAADVNARKIRKEAERVRCAAPSKSACHYRKDPAVTATRPSPTTIGVQGLGMLSS
jgi:hypothetical protein